MSPEPILLIGDSRVIVANRAGQRGGGSSAENQQPPERNLSTRRPNVREIR